MHGWRVFTKGIATLPPGRRIVYLSDIPSRRFNTANMPLRHEFTIMADGPFGPVSPLVYDVDLEPLFYARAGQTTTKDIVTTLTETNRVLTGITKAVIAADERGHTSV